MRWLFSILCFLVAPILVQAADSFDLNKTRQHWAFLPFKKIELPKVNQPRWGMHEIDRFVGARLPAEIKYHIGKILPVDF